MYNTEILQIIQFVFKVYLRTRITSVIFSVIWKNTVNCNSDKSLKSPTVNCVQLYYSNCSSQCFSKSRQVFTHSETELHYIYQHQPASNSTDCFEVFHIRWKIDFLNIFKILHIELTKLKELKQLSEASAGTGIILAISIWVIVKKL